MEVTTNAARKRLSVKIDSEEAEFRLRMHAIHLSHRNGSGHVSCVKIVQDLILAHIPEYHLIDTQASAASTQSDGAKSQGSERDGKKQAGRTRGRAR